MKYQDCIFHPPEYSSGKKHRVSCSSFGSQLLAAADEYDRGYYLTFQHESISIMSKIHQLLFVDLQGLFSSIPTVHEPLDYRLMNRVAKIEVLLEGR